MTLSQARTEYPDEWIAFRIRKAGEDPTGEVVLHDKDRAEFHRAVLGKRLTDVYLTFTGAPLPEGASFLF